LDFKALLCGKISLDDLARPEISSLLNFEGILLPPFMEDMVEYLNSLEEIAKCNHIESIEELGEEETKKFSDSRSKEAGQYYHSQTGPDEYEEGR
jgi:hypothetical protein